MSVQPRSQPTRDKILLAARRLFAERGYEKTTVRAVAAAADINVSMVIRYFGSKDGLFAAAAAVVLRPRDLSDIPAERIGRAIIEHVLKRCDDPDTGGELHAVMRAAATHEAARQKVIETVMDRSVNNVCGNEASRVPDEKRAFVLTIIAGLTFSRYILKHPMIVAMERDKIIATFGDIIQAYLDSTEPSDPLCSGTLTP